ncbi:murein hydrolase activator EnvC family protein [Sphingomonas profundi]|uniref:murein hydrolase activator EnvC family protein n=1 Tax=Alterirhizorhabdus profundi TaxID=2681549 RepID=UPI0012E7D21B|nr:peptidoglycan DD-metalloendopeptidase family protein [Sphingomonas profundi]
MPVSAPVRLASAAATIERGRLARIVRDRLAARAGVALLALLAAPLAAQTLGAEADALARAKREAVQAQRRSAALEVQAARAADEAARARARAAAVASRILAAEADITAAEARIRIVARLRERQRARLAAKQGPIVGLAAGLQTMARRPPALALVQRGSIADLVHLRAILAGQMPLVRARTAALRQDVDEGIRLQAQADRAAATLRAGQARLRAERTALARLEADRRGRAQTYTDSAMLEEDRATALGEQARDIVDLMGRIGEQAEVARRLASLPGPLPRPPIPGLAAAPAADALGAAPNRLRYRLPVVGKVVTGLGEVSEAGVRARGLTLAARPGAQVVAPAGGRIAYAGPFRNYGGIVIIDHGGGWTSLVTNLAQLSVKVGDLVDLAGPIGRAAGARPQVTVELRRGGRPVDITPLVAAG